MLRYKAILLPSICCYKKWADEKAGKSYSLLHTPARRSDALRLSELCGVDGLTDGWSEP